MSYLRTVCIEVKIFMKLREYCFLLGQSRCYCTEKLKHCNNTTLLVGIRGSFLENIIQLSPGGEVNSGGYIPRREALRYISTALHRPRGG